MRIQYFMRAISAVEKSKSKVREIKSSSESVRIFMFYER